MRKKYERDGSNKTDFGGKKTVKINNCRIIRETEKAWLLQLTALDRKETDPADPFWVPKSQCQLWSHATKRNLHDLEIVKTIAEEKGLLEGTADESAIMDEFDQLIRDRENKK